MSHSGQNVIQLYTWEWEIIMIISSRVYTSEYRKYVPAVKLSRAEHNDPIMSRGIAPHDLVHDVSGHGAGAEHSE